LRVRHLLGLHDIQISESYLFFTVPQRINDQYKLNVNYIILYIHFKVGLLAYY